MLLNEAAYRAGFAESNAFPGVDGEIQINIYHGPVYIEFIVEANGTINFAYDYNDKTINYENNLTEQMALERIRVLRGVLWGSSDVWTEFTLMPGNSGLRVSLSGRQVMAAASPSSTKTASARMGDQSVSIFKGTIHQTPEPPLSFGSLTSRAYPPTASWSQSQATLEMSVTEISRELLSAKQEA